MIDLLTVQRASGAEDHSSVNEQQAAKLAQTTAGGKLMPQHDWMHHFQLPRFLSPTTTGQSSATAADSPNPSSHQMLAESFRRRSFSTQEELPSLQVPLWQLSTIQILLAVV